MPQSNDVVGRSSETSKGSMGALERHGENFNKPYGGSGPLGSPLDLETGDRVGLVSKVETRLYYRRWVMLFLFSTYSASNAFMWLQYGIIGNIFMRFYDIDALALDWLSMIYLLTYVPFIVPVMWMLDKRGLRDVVLTGAAFNCIGACIKIGSAEPDQFVVTFIGQFLCSVGTVFILGIPPHLASVWFGESEVSTACSIGVLGNQVRVLCFGCYTDLYV